MSSANLDGAVGNTPPPINKCISKALRTQCSTCLFSTLVLNLQLLVRSTAIESAPAIWNSLTYSKTSFLLR